MAVEESFLGDPETLIEYPDIAQIVKENIIREKKTTYACNSIWASEIGHDCERYLVYQQCNGEDAQQTEDDLLLVFNEGDNQERQLIIDLQKANIKVKDLQLRFTVKAINLSGKLDLIAELKDSEGDTFFAPVEVKSMHPSVYSSIETVADLNKYPWTRKYYAQLMYQLENDQWSYPFGYFLCKNKSTGEIKVIKDFDGSPVVKFNQEYYNKLFEKGRRVSKTVLANKIIQSQLLGTEDESEKEALKSQLKYPERIKYDLKVCGGCKYNHICIANIIDSNTKTLSESAVVTVKEYLRAKQQREIYSQAEKEYKKADAEMKKIFPLQEDLYTSGEYIIQTKVTNGKNPYLKFDIQNLGDTNTD